jgi:hypothetical protein
MAVALVGTIGAASVGALSTAVTPAYGTGETRVAGNLLILYCTITGSATLPTTPSGWSIAKQVAGTSCSATVYYKVAAGNDAAPTIALVTGGYIVGQLAEFSGVAATTPLDQSGSATGTTSPVTATFAGADTTAGELIVACGADLRSVARASNDTWTGNHCTFILGGSNNGVSNLRHYSDAYAVATSSNAGADTAIMTLSIATSITGLAVAAVTFKLPPAQTISPTAVGRTPSVATPASVVPGAVSVNPLAVARTPSVATPASVVPGAVNVNPLAVARTPSIATPASVTNIIPAQSIAALAVASLAAVATPTAVTPGAVAVAALAVSRTPSVAQPASLTTGPVSIAALAVARSPVAATPASVTPGAVSVAALAVASTAAVAAPATIRSLFTITAQAVTRTPAVGQPASVTPGVVTIAAQAVQRTPQVGAPAAVTAGPVSILAGAVPSSASVAAPGSVTAPLAVHTIAALDVASVAAVGTPASVTQLAGPPQTISAQAAPSTASVATAEAVLPGPVTIYAEAVTGHPTVSRQPSLGDQIIEALAVDSVASVAIPTAIRAPVPQVVCRGRDAAWPTTLPKSRTQTIAALAVPSSASVAVPESVTVDTNYLTALCDLDEAFTLAA